jgi:pimeloyl-ACP methyl ester carboxylesterase
MMKLELKVQHEYAENNGVKIHFAAMGQGKPIIMIHGFPDFWYTWRRQMEGLAGSYRVAAIDQRGYNLSDKPQGVENYAVQHLIGDVKAVLKKMGAEKATIIGHDWGGFVAWMCALHAPQMVENLVVLNIPHPKCMSRELANNKTQARVAQYARDFQKPGAHTLLTAEKLTEWVTDQEAKAEYIEAMQKSDFEALLNYYKANYPREPYQEMGDVPKIEIPTLYIHGLKDWAMLPGCLNETWNFVGKDFTLVTLPQAGHFVQQDAADFVTATIKSWLSQRV